MRSSRRISRLVLLVAVPGIVAAAVAVAWLTTLLAQERSHASELGTRAARYDVLSNALGSVSSETMYLTTLQAFGTTVPADLAQYAAGAESMRHATSRAQIVSLLLPIDRDGAQVPGSLSKLGVVPPAHVTRVLAPLSQRDLDNLRNDRPTSLRAADYSNAAAWLTIAAGKASREGELARAQLVELRDATAPWRDPALVGGVLALALAISVLVLVARRRLMSAVHSSDAEREALTQRTAQLDALLEVMRVSSSSPDQTAIARTVAERAVVVAAADFAVVALEQREQLVAIAAAGGVVPVDAPATAGLLGRVLDTGTPASAVVPSEPLFEHEDEPISIVAAPLVVDRAVAGVVCVGRRRSELFDDDDRVGVQLLAAGAASALETARLHEATAELSVIDALTGLYNRRRLSSDLVSSCETARREQTSVALLMLDLDHFKRLNDSEGHLAGDAALRRVAGIVGACLRGNDSMYRYGGEEFAVLLPGATLEDARAAGERIRAAVALDGAPAGDATPLTISIGVASSTDPDPACLVAEADAALYAAKRAGRNRVVASGDHAEAA